MTIEAWENVTMQVLQPSIAQNGNFSLSYYDQFNFSGQDVTIVQQYCTQWTIFTTAFAGLILSLYFADVVLSHTKYQHHVVVRLYLHNMIAAMTIFYCVTLLMLGVW